MESYILNKHKIVNHCLVAKELVDEMRLTVGLNNDDFLKDLFSMQLETYLKGLVQPTKVLTYYTPRPSFLDWLLQRTHPVKVIVYTHDIIKQPVAEGFVRLTEAKMSDDD